jgi:hypothetical protein
MDTNRRSNEKIEENIHQRASKLLTTVRTNGPCLEADFNALHEPTLELTRSLQGRELISKSLLNVIYDTYRDLYSAAERTHSVELRNMAEKPNFCFSLILMNETAASRKAGVPRII